MNYTLRFPFELPQGREISNPEVHLHVDDLEVSLGREDQFYVLKISGFKSEQAAERYLANVRAGFMWLLLNHGLAVKAQWTPQKVAYSNDPHQAAQKLREVWGFDVGPAVHGIIDGAWPAVYPTAGNFRKVTANPVSVRQSTAAADAEADLRQGLRSAKPEALIANSKLQTAVELYGAFFTESSPRARFLALMMALESLSEGKSRPAKVQDLLNKWLSEVEALERNAETEPDEAATLEALKREILFRREDSIRNQIRALVLTTLAREPDVHGLAGKAVRLYDSRSKLVHEGTLPLNELSSAITDAKDLVNRVLKARFVKVGELQEDEHRGHLDEPRSGS